jgi:hypothetical protein
LGGSRKKFLPFQDGEKTDLISLAKENGYCAIYIDSEVWELSLALSHGQTMQLPQNRIRNFLETLT